MYGTARLYIKIVRGWREREGRDTIVNVDIFSSLFFVLFNV